MSLKDNEKNKIMLPLKENQNILSIMIKSYEERHIERKSEVYFIIHITNNISNKKWKLEKSIIDFQNLYEKILKLYKNLPPIPKKTIFKITSMHILDIRKYSLQHFLNHCINRKDILLNTDFINFLEIPKNSPELIGNSITQIQRINQFDLSITNFIYNKNKNIIIISFYDNEFISIDEISLDNILMIKNNGVEPKKPIGYVRLYEYIIDKENINIKDSFNLKKLWEISFLIQTKNIFFDEKNEILCIGNDDGGIYLYKTKTKGNFNEMEVYAELTFHSDRISGLYLNSEEMNLYSCSYDNTFFVTDLKDNNFIKSLIYNNICGYTGLKYIQENKIFITSDEDGIISVFSFENIHYILSLNIQTSSLDKINSLYTNEKYVITGGNNGKVCIIDLSLIKGKLINEIISFDIGIYQITCIVYNSKNDEIIIGDEIGRIIIWNNKIKNFIYSWDAHSQSKVNYLFLDENNILWSFGEDKYIKKWKIPEKWFKDNIYLYSNISNFNENKKQNNIFEDKDDDSISSEEDELNRWSYK